MATIKSYTDLEQSKKLAEILPLESADMCWTKHIDNGDITSLHVAVNYGIVTIGYPCWSLATLLDILPDRTCVFKKTYKDGRVKYQGVMEGNKELILKDNSVDACYELILKSHELNLL